VEASGGGAGQEERERGRHRHSSALLQAAAMEGRWSLGLPKLPHLTFARFKYAPLLRFSSVKAEGGR
jgi:hypothetical protein